jgi:NADPH:quinone reductase-like Zn-dependent oxidoreductase
VQLAHKPAALSFAEAAALPLVGITSIQALLEDHHLSPGQNLLLIGASGGVGHIALQVAMYVSMQFCSLWRKRRLDRSIGALNPQP